MTIDPFAFAFACFVTWLLVVTARTDGRPPGEMPEDV